MGWGEFFALAAPLAWGLAVVLFRRSGETLPAFELNLTKNLLAFTLMIPTVLLWGGMVVPDFSLAEYSLMFLSGGLGMALADTWYLKALNIMGASRTGIVGSLLSPFVIVLSAVILGERLTPWQWAGFALVMSGILLFTWRRNRAEVDTDRVGKGIVYGVAAIFLMAVGVVMVKEILETRPFVWVVEIRLLGGLVGMLVVILLRRQWSEVRNSFRQPHPWSMTLTASFLGGYLAMVLWLAGYKLLSASVASIYNEAQGSFIVLFAWLILGEAINSRKIAGLALTLAGVVIMLIT